MLKQAAELQGRTMTDFVVAAVQDAAQRAIEEAGFVRLSLPIRSASRRRCYRHRNQPRPWSVLLLVAASSCALNERRTVSRRSA